MLAALNLGHFGVKLHAPDGVGATWQEVATPAYPPRPENDKGVPWKLGRVWSPVAAHGTVWAGTLPRGLFRSADFGVSWNPVDSLWSRTERVEWFGGGYDVPGIQSTCPHPPHAGEVRVVIRCGGAWGTPDDGATWSLQARGMRAAFMPPERPHNLNIQDPYAIVRCAAAPGVPRCQRHCGIWSSTDDAAGGQVVVGAVPVSNFGFAVAVHPVGQDTAWFATAQVDEKRVPVDSAMVVNRTRGGGCRFEKLLHGLSQTHCCDLIYRHGLAVANDGGSLLMGSTTGGLGSSSHGCDRWLKVSPGLPPAHAVKFGQVLYRGVSGGAGLWRRPHAASLELGRATRVGG